MPVTIRVEVQDSATAAAVALHDALGKGLHAKAVARVASAEFVKNFERLAASRHRGGQHNYYLTAARSTLGTAQGGDAVVTVYAPAGIALRRYGSGGLPGGVVKPSGRISQVTGKPIKSMSIPREGGPADGRVPLDIKTAGVVLKLRVLKSINRAALVGKDPASGRMTVYFWLVKSVRYHADSAVFPADADLSKTINATLDRYAKTVWAQHVRRYTNGR
jgi:hypothetical protein